MRILKTKSLSTIESCSGSFKLSKLYKMGKIFKYSNSIAIESMEIEDINLKKWPDRSRVEIRVELERVFKIKIATIRIGSSIAMVNKKRVDFLLRRTRCERRRQHISVSNRLNFLAWASQNGSR
jgi:translation initiation factor 2 gamma subunit (eIF-2gamma)